MCTTSISTISKAKSVVRTYNIIKDLLRVTQTSLSTVGGHEIKIL